MHTVCLELRVMSDSPDLLSSLLLLLVVIVNATAVLGTPVTALLVQGGGVNVLEKTVQQLGVASLFWVKIHLTINGSSCSLGEADKAWKTLQ